MKEEVTIELGVVLECRFHCGEEAVKPKSRNRKRNRRLWAEMLMRSIREQKREFKATNHCSPGPVAILHYWRSYGVLGDVQAAVRPGFSIQPPAGAVSEIDHARQKSERHPFPQRSCVIIPNQSKSGHGRGTLIDNGACWHPAKVCDELANV